MFRGQNKELLNRQVLGSRLLGLCGRALTTATFFLAHCCWADDYPFFVTYTTHLEHPGELEIETRNVTGKPRDGNRFLGSVLEFEYGATTWWTTEVYLDGQTTANDNTLFTGYRWENRFRLLPGRHWINPVLYLEYENVNEADKALLEITGHDGIDDLNVPAAEARLEIERAIEGKLLLDSHFKGWTLAENLIVEKDVRHGPYEFGYAAGIYRYLGGSTQRGHCTFCLSSVQAGVEMYGGLGTTSSFGLQNTSHYLAPAVSWRLPHEVALKFSPGFGLTDTSVGFLMRFGALVEVDDFGSAVAKLFRGSGRSSSSSSH